MISAVPLFLKLVLPLFIPKGNSSSASAASILPPSATPHTPPEFSTVPMNIITSPRVPLPNASYIKNDDGSLYLPPTELAGYSADGKDGYPDEGQLWAFPQGLPEHVTPVTFQKIGETSFQQQHLAVTAVFDLSYMLSVCDKIDSHIASWHARAASVRAFEIKSLDGKPLAPAHDALATRWENLGTRASAVRRRLRLLQQMNVHIMHPDEPIRDKRFVVVGSMLLAVGLASVIGLGVGAAGYALSLENSGRSDDIESDLATLANSTKELTDSVLSALVVAEEELSHVRTVALLGEMEDYTLRAESSFTAATLERVHPSILADRNVTSLVQSVHGFGRRRNVELFTSSPADLVFCRTLLTPTDTGFHIAILIPAGPSESVLEVWQPFVMPIPVADGTFVLPDIADLYLAINENDSRYRGLTTYDIDRCRRTGGYLDCDHIAKVRRFSTHIPDQEDAVECLFALYTKRVDLAAVVCPRKFIRPEEHVTPIASNRISFFSATNQTTSVVCPEKVYYSTKSYIPIPAFRAISIPLNAGCYFTSNRHIFSMPADKINVTGWTVRHNLDLSALRPPGDLTAELLYLSNSRHHWLDHRTQLTPDMLRQARTERLTQSFQGFSAPPPVELPSPWSLSSLLPAWLSSAGTALLAAAAIALVACCCCRKRRSVTLEPVYECSNGHECRGSVCQSVRRPPPPPYYDDSSPSPRDLRNSRTRPPFSAPAQRLPRSASSASVYQSIANAAADAAAEAAEFIRYPDLTADLELPRLSGRLVRFNTDVDVSSAAPSSSDAAAAAAAAVAEAPRPAEDECIMDQARPLLAALPYINASASPPPSPLPRGPKPTPPPRTTKSLPTSPALPRAKPASVAAIDPQPAADGQLLVGAGAGPATRPSPPSPPLPPVPGPPPPVATSVTEIRRLAACMAANTGRARAAATAVAVPKRPSPMFAYMTLDAAGPSRRPVV